MKDANGTISLSTNGAGAMGAALEPRAVAELMLSWIGLELLSFVDLETLWAGYGHICAIEAAPAPRASPRGRKGGEAKCQGDSLTGVRQLILKFISPPVDGAQDEGHLRKLLSYEVEQYFYDEIVPRIKDDVSVAQCLVSTRSGREKAVAAGLDGVTATIMTDLRPDFPVAGQKREVLSPKQAAAALEWLARYHSSYWAHPSSNIERLLLPPLEESERRQAKSGTAGNRLWLNGGYTYLATRQREYLALCRDHSSEWSAAFCTSIAKDYTPTVADVAAHILKPRGRPFETFIHGDVKSENLFSTASGDDVAFYDFQYAGLGLGACDIAKLFTCSVPLFMLTGANVIPRTLPIQDAEMTLLEQYRETLLGRGGPDSFDYDWDLFVRHWETALIDWCRFQASWGFWGHTEWLQARVRWILDDPSWRQWAISESKALGL